MATLKQKRLALAIVKNSQKAKPLNKQELVVSSGYGVITADRHASEVIDSKGVQEELSALGFTEENAKAVTAQILLNPKEASRDRLKAAEMAFKVHGSFAPGQDSPATNVQNFFFNASIQTATRAYEENLKRLIANETTEPIQEETESNATGSS